MDSVTHDQLFSLEGNSLGNGHLHLESSWLHNCSEIKLQLRCIRKVIIEWKKGVICFAFSVFVRESFHSVSVTDTVIVSVTEYSV